MTGDDDLLSPDEAGRLARGALGQDAYARGWLVSGGGERGPYYVVVLGPPEGSTGVAAVDAISGEVTHSAWLPGTQPHIQVDQDQARSLARAPATAPAELTWSPGDISMSPLYPFWAVQVSGSRMVYVDQTGAVYTELRERDHRGGGGRSVAPPPGRDPHL